MISLMKLKYYVCCTCICKYVLYILLFNSLQPMYGNNNFLNNVLCMLILIFDFSTSGSLSVNSEELLIMFLSLSKCRTSR